MQERIIEIIVYLVNEMRNNRSLGEIDVKVLEEGKVVCDLPTIAEMRARRQSDVDRLDDGVRRFVNPHLYHVSLTERLWQKKQDVWKRKHKFNVRNLDEWNKLKNAVEQLIPKLAAKQ
jgi:hypothetical protein